MYLFVIIQSFIFQLNVFFFTTVEVISIRRHTQAPCHHNLHLVHDSKRGKYPVSCVLQVEIQNIQVKNMTF